MPSPITLQLGRLADRLGDLRVRLKDAARIEVAQAIADALADTTRSLICGPGDRRPDRYDNAPWDDPWREPYVEARSWAKSHDAASPPDRSSAPYQTALMTGFAVARWSLMRTGQPAAAVGLAVAAALVVLFAGERIAPLLDICSATQELLDYPKPHS